MQINLGKGDNTNPLNNVVGSILWFVGLAIITISILVFVDIINFSPTLQWSVLLGSIVVGVLFLGFAEVIFLLTQIANRN